MSDTLAIIPCSRLKIFKTYPHLKGIKAKWVYASVHFKFCKKYVEQMRLSYLILSAKYGYIEPDFVINEDYNITFKKKSNLVVSLKTLRQQAIEFGDYKTIVNFGGKDYTFMIKNSFCGKSIISPLDGLSIGFRLSKLKQAIDNNENLLKDN